MKRKNIFQIAVSDFTFKRFFATEKNKKYLIFFLNALVGKYIGKKQKGRAEGMENGRTETRFLIASNLLQQDLDIPTIVKASGLTEAEILKVG